MTNTHEAIRTPSYARKPAPRGALVLALSTLIFTLLPPALAASEGDNGIVKDLGGLEVELLLGKDGAKVGTNTVMLRIHDAEDKPVSDAMIMLEVAMDTGSTMTMDMSKEKPKGVQMVADSMEEGMYQGKVELGFTGKWIAKVDLSRGSTMAKADFPFEVSAGGPNWTVLIVFGLAIALVIGAAALLRSRKPKAAGGAT